MTTFASCLVDTNQSRRRAAHEVFPAPLQDTTETRWVSTKAFPMEDCFSHGSNCKISFANPEGSSLY